MINEVLKHISEAPVMINIYPGAAELICRFIEVLHEQDYPAIEILARPLDEALDLVRRINDSPQRKLIHIGMGTIKTQEDAQRAVEVQPDFIVSPAFSRRVLDVAVKAGIPYIPAVCTLQDVQDVMDAFEDVGRDVRVLKLCPVEIVTYKYVKILGAIYPGIVFCPTGTVALEDLPEWNKLQCIGPAMESSFVPREMIEAKDWQAVRNRLNQIRQLVGKELL